MPAAGAWPPAFPQGLLERPERAAARTRRPKPATPPGRARRPAPRSPRCAPPQIRRARPADRKSTRLNSSHLGISDAVFCFIKRSGCPLACFIERDPRADLNGKRKKRHDEAQEPKVAFIEGVLCRLRRHVIFFF